MAKVRKSAGVMVTQEMPDENIRIITRIYPFVEGQSGNSYDGVKPNERISTQGWEVVGCTQKFKKMNGVRLWVLKTVMLKEGTTYPILPGITKKKNATSKATPKSSK